MLGRALFLLLTLALPASAMLFHGGPQTALIFVATTGNDSNPGTLTSPLLTPVAAQTLERSRLAAGVSNVTVNFRGGTYAISSTLTFTAADSPATGNEVTWQSYPGENAVFDAGTTVTGWSLCTTSDAVCNSGAGSGTACGGSACAVWEASVTSPADFREAYFNGTHGMRSGTQTESGPAPYPAGFTTSGTMGLTTPLNATTPTTLWKNYTNVEYAFQQGWETHYCKIASISGTSTTLANNCRGNLVNVFLPEVSIGHNTPAWVENAYELLPVCGYGCWYNDITAHILYYIPRPGESMTGGSAIPVSVPTFGPTLVTFNGASNMILNRLSFEHATWLEPDDGTSGGYAEQQAGFRCNESGAGVCNNQTSGYIGIAMPGVVYGENGANNITVSHDLFTHNAGRAIFFDIASQNNVIYANLVQDSGGGGIDVGGVSDYANTTAGTQTSGNAIKDNEVDFGSAFEYRNSASFVVPVAKTTTITNNYSNGSWVGPFNTGWWGWATNHFVSYDDANVESNNWAKNIRGYFPMQDAGSFYNNGPNGLGGGTGLAVTNNYAGGSGQTEACFYPDEGSGLGGTIGTTGTYGAGATSNWDNNVCDGTPSNYIFMWTNTIYNQSFVGNYTTNTTLNNTCGGGCTVSGTVTISAACGANAPCLAIVAAAGLQAGIVPGP